MLKEIIKNHNEKHTTQPYPKLRNFVLDVMGEGRKKNIIYNALEVDVTDVRKIMRIYKEKKIPQFHLQAILPVVMLWL